MPERYYNLDEDLVDRVINEIRAVGRVASDPLIQLEKVLARAPKMIADASGWRPLLITVPERETVGCTAYWSGQAFSVQWRQDQGVPVVPTSSGLRQVGKFDRAVIRAILQETMRQLDAIDGDES